MKYSMTQYIGFPEVTPAYLIKFGFFLDGRNPQWVVEVKGRRGKFNVKFLVNSVAEARTLAEDLKRKYALRDG